MHEERRPPVELHRLIFALVHSPETARRLREEPDAVYEQFGVPLEQRSQLKEDPRKALRDLHVHPNLQFKYLGACHLLKLAPASIQSFLEKGDRSDGTDS